jgi:hypothetical protein
MNPENSAQRRDRLEPALYVNGDLVPIDRHRSRPALVIGNLEDKAVGAGIIWVSANAEGVRALVVTQNQPVGFAAFE